MPFSSPGTSLYEACESNEVELGPLTTGGPPVDVHSERWTEPVFGEGPTSGYDHVVLSGPGVDTAGPVTRAGEWKKRRKKSEQPPF